MLVSFWISLFFREAPRLDDQAQARLGAAVNDVTGTRKSLAVFIKNHIARDFLLYGRAIVHVSKAAFTAKNNAVKKAMGIRPVMEVINPLDLPDWDIETSTTARAGRVNMARFEYDLIESRIRATEEPKLSRYCLEYYRQDSGVIAAKYKASRSAEGGAVTTGLDIDWEQIDETPLALAEIPIAIEDDESWIKDAAEEALRYHNLRSTKDNVEYQQGFQKIHAITSMQADNAAARRAVSEYTISLWPEGSQIIFGAPVDTSSLEASVRQSMDTFFKVGLNQFKALPSESKAVQSADTLGAERDSTVALVQSSLEDIEGIANQALEHWAGYEQQPAGKVELDKNISAEDFDEFIQLVTAFKDEFSKVEILEKEILKKAAGRLRLRPETLAEVEKAIDSMQEEDKQQPGTNALDSVFGGGVSGEEKAQSDAS
jgi:hypothetical protein